MKKVILLILLIVLSNKLIKANDAGVENIFDYGGGGRALGLGNAYTAVADDSSSIFWNPAGLGILNYSELMLFHTFLFYSTYYNFISFAYPIIHIGTFGLGVFRVGTGEIIFRSPHNIITSDDITSEQMQFLVGYGIKLNFPFSVGTTIKVNTLKIGRYSDVNVSFDIGVLMEASGPYWRKIFGKYQLRNFKFGINVKNIFSTPIKLQTTEEYEIMNIKMGCSYFFYIKNNLNHKILTSADLNFYQRRKIKFNVGLEYNIYRIFFIRGGYNQNIGFVLGSGIKYWKLRLDYSLAFQQINLSHRISLLWQFGRSVEEQRRAEQERIKRETERKVKIAIEKKTREYKEKITQLETKYKTDMQKVINDLTQKYQQEKEKLIEEIKLKSKEEQQRLINELQQKYEQERQQLLSSLSNKYEVEKQKLIKELNQKFKKEKARLARKLIANEQFKRKHYTKGIELFEKGDYDGAIAEFKTVIRFDPNYSEAKKYLKRAKSAKRKPTTYPKKIMDLYYKGIDFYVAGEYKKAIAVWKKILKIDPYNNLAIRNINDAEKKLRELKRWRKSKKKK